MKKFFMIYTVFYLISVSQFLHAFDHQHSQWHAILQENVHFNSTGVASRVDYSNIKKNSFALEQYLKILTTVNNTEFNHWSKNQQKAFLINAYNAFTVQLILTRYPDIKSIKEIGSFFSNPWKKKFFKLLNKKRSLDELEHTMLRKEGVYDDPYIHVALVCASIGCPALRNEAYTADRIEQQLADSMYDFLSDKERNRYHSDSNTFEVSKIFDWYEEDFNKGYRGIFSLSDLLSRYSRALSNQEIPHKKPINSAKISYLDYDWSLNDWHSDIENTDKNK
ncbi:MAG: DUF547 domain-containing protein [Gammaproteobacteria bacterium]|nr:DUF547 domain-containing protein [Gammaproteobacteria bacterium]